MLKANSIVQARRFYYLYIRPNLNFYIIASFLEVRSKAFNLLHNFSDMCWRVIAENYLLMTHYSLKNFLLFFIFHIPHRPNQMSPLLTTSRIQGLLLFYYFFHKNYFWAASVDILRIERVKYTLLYYRTSIMEKAAVVFWNMKMSITGDTI